MKSKMPTILFIDNWHFTLCPGRALTTGNKRNQKKINICITVF